MSQTPQDTQSSRKNYHEPEFRDYGTVQELTRTSDNSFTAPLDSKPGSNASLSPSAPAQIPFYVTGGGT